MFPIVQTPGVKQFNGANPKGGSRGGGTPRTRVSRKLSSPVGPFVAILPSRRSSVTTQETFCQ